MRASRWVQTEAQQQLAGTQTAYKNELLFSQFQTNYNDLPVMFRRGSTVIRVRLPVTREDGKVREKEQVIVTHDDIIKDAFWAKYPHILAD